MRKGDDSLIKVDTAPGIFQKGNRFLLCLDGYTFELSAAQLQAIRDSAQRNIDRPFIRSHYEHRGATS